KIGPDPRNFNQRVSLGRNDLLIRTFPMALRLSHVVGGSWSKWMLIQEQFELQLAQREIKELMILTNIGDEVVGL
ncbi:hypothetical protein OGX87_08185, partial [Citrobacter sp. Cpo085]|nr:hypothetical protein [Citrobacter sp. Cpo085]